MGRIFWLNIRINPNYVSQGDVVTVVEEYDNGEQTLRKGQKVEYVERSGQDNDSCVIRLLSDETGTLENSKGGEKRLSRQISASTDTGYGEPSSSRSVEMVVPARILHIPGHSVSYTESKDDSKGKEEVEAFRIWFFLVLNEAVIKNLYLSLSA